MDYLGHSDKRSVKEEIEANGMRDVFISFEMLRDTFPQLSRHEHEDMKEFAISQLRSSKL